MNEIKLGTIGTGSIVNHILTAAEHAEGISLKAVYSRSEEKGMKLADLYGAGKVYTDLTKMLEDPEINTVYIASPNALHYEQIREALLHRKHVICEKPLCARAEQVRELTKLAEDQGFFLIDATTTAYLPNFKILKEHLPDIGRIRLVLCNYSQYSGRYDLLRKTGPADEIPNVFNPAFAGGSLMDIDYYNVYFAAALFGKPDKCVYFPNICRTGVDTSGILILAYPDFIFDAAGAKDTWGINYAQIEGEDGYIYVENGSNGIEKVKVITRDGEKEYNDQTYSMANETNRYHYEIEKITEMMLMEKREEIFRSLKNAEITVDILEDARKSAGILFPGD